MWPFSRKLVVRVDMRERPNPMPPVAFLHERLIRAGLDLRKSWSWSGDWFGIVTVYGRK
jgi:hypothetical protein